MIRMRSGCIRLARSHCSWCLKTSCIFVSRGELTAYDVQNGQDGEACSLPEDVASLVT